MLDRIKTIGIVVLLIFTLVTAFSTVGLIKANTKLHTEIALVQGELDNSRATVTKLQDAAKIEDDSLKQQIESGVKVDEVFTNLNSQLADIKCPKITEVKERVQYVNRPIVPADTNSPAGDIANVGRLLDQAACAANSDCPSPSEVAPSGL